jgi:hypothetical protein
MRKRQTGNQEDEGQRKISVGKYGSKLWCQRLQWYKCENEKDARRRENAETSAEEDMQIKIL